MVIIKNWIEILFLTLQFIISKLIITYQALEQFVFLNKTKNVFHNGPEWFLFNSFLRVTQSGDDVRHHVVQSVALLGQLGKEEFGEAGDLVDRVHDAARHVGDLPLHLDHVVEDEVGEDGQGVGPHAHGLVVKPRVHARSPGLHRVGKPGC